MHSYCKRQRRCSRQPVAAALKNRNRATKIHDLNSPVSDSLPVISPYLSSPCCAFSAPPFRSPSWIFINLFIYIQHFKLPMRLSPALSYCAKYSHLGNKTYPLTPTSHWPNIHTSATCTSYGFKQPLQMNDFATFDMLPLYHCISYVPISDN